MTEAEAEQARLRLVPPDESLTAHLAHAKARLERADLDQVNAIGKLADCYQRLELQFRWFSRKQWVMILLCSVPLLEVLWKALS